MSRSLASAGVGFLAIIALVWVVFTYRGSSELDGSGAVKIVSGDNSRSRDSGSGASNLTTGLEERSGSAWSLPVVPANPNGTPPLDPTGDPEQTRHALSQQPKDPLWAPRAESAVRSAFSAAGWTSGITVDCRSTGCEITGELSSLTSSNLKQVVSKLSGPMINQQLVNSGLKPDVDPVYTVVSQSPLRLTFSRIVIKSSAT